MIHTMKLINVLKVSPTLGISEIDVESLDIKKKNTLIFFQTEQFSNHRVYILNCVCLKGLKKCSVFKVPEASKLSESTFLALFHKVFKRFSSEPLWIREYLCGRHL